MEALVCKETIVLCQRGIKTQKFAARGILDNFENITRGIIAKYHYKSCYCLYKCHLIYQIYPGNIIIAAPVVNLGNS